MGFVHNEKVVEALRSDRANEPLCKCIRVRGSKGRLQDLGALGLEHFVEARHVLGVTIADQELGSDVCVGEVAGDVPRLLDDPRRVRMSGHAGDPDPSAPEFDEEQHIEAFEQHGVDMEEVRGHDTRRLDTQELAPGGTVAPRSRSQAVVLHDPGDGARGQAHPELEQLTLDAAVARSVRKPDSGGDQGSCISVAIASHPRCYRMKEPGDRASGAHILPAVVGQRSTAPGVRPDQRPDRDFGALHRFRSVPGTYGLTCRLYSTPGGPAVSPTLGQIVEVVKVAASA
jgi:hypothetical protein